MATGYPTAISFRFTMAIDPARDQVRAAWRIRAAWRSGRVLR
jgi:hypothetical protein